MSSIKALLRDESGMTMGLAVIMLVLIGVMGAGLLTFVQRDLDAVVTDNKGQRAFELADAGVQAAKRQLTSDSIPGHYDGGSADVRWATSQGGTSLTNLDGSAATTDSVNVKIEYKLANNSFVVTSTGDYSDARRRIEAVFTRTAGASLPPAYFTRNSLNVNGAFASDALSYFALGNATIGVSSTQFSLGNSDDAGFKRWAETTDSQSYPNAFNATARSSSLGGIAVRGTLTNNNSTDGLVAKNTRSFDRLTSPRVVADYYASKTTPSTNPVDPSIISFPFDPTLLQNPDGSYAFIETLRAEAQKQETATPGNDNYRNPSTAGTTYNINPSDWPSSSSENTVVFYRFPTWNVNNKVVWNINAPCTNSTRKGVIVVENGNFEIAGNRGGFNGTVVTWGGVDPATGQPYPDRGKFTSAGGACMTGYANASGDMTLSGNFSAGTVPGLSSIAAFAGNVKLVSWRELYS
ncbi:hypothetical protein GBA65_05225 [Rubrobacter marinus]|uniref:Type 4 fimbrial biogenesis protein PilX N-terminal domain-containing protein n=1 Tax=Rubrobacter marinus TaxID=2653852 RepID=A0A6G8PUZ8_9ACTN|nr:hypothetical protein [Rubrobacter marinus]QIN78018.1 hypothetical protein GBA65_05225 [Rubrobacter marinus]